MSSQSQQATTWLHELGCGPDPNLPPQQTNPRTGQREPFAWQVEDRGILFLELANLWVEVKCYKIETVRYVFFLDRSGMSYGFEAYKVPVLPVPHNWKLWE